MLGYLVGLGIWVRFGFDSGIWVLHAWHRFHQVTNARYPNVLVSLVAIDFSPSRASLTNPKSKTFDRKSSPKRMFEDLRSRCIKVSRAKL